MIKGGKTNPLTTVVICSSRFAEKFLTKIERLLIYSLQFRDNLPQSCLPIGYLQAVRFDFIAAHYAVRRAAGRGGVFAGSNAVGNGYRESRIFLLGGLENRAGKFAPAYGFITALVIEAVGEGGQ